MLVTDLIEEATNPIIYRNEINIKAVVGGIEYATNLFVIMFPFRDTH